MNRKLIANLAKVFKDLKVKPKADSTKDFTEWWKEFVGTLPVGTHPVKTEPDVNETQDSASKSVIQTPNVPNIIEEFYRISQQGGEDSISWSCRLEEMFIVHS